MESLLAHVEKLRSILTYHVVPGRILSSDLREGTTEAATLLESTPALTLDLQARHHTLTATVAPDAPAVYVHRRSLGFTPIDTVWMFATTVEECPGSMAIAVDVDEAMVITAERRLHSLESTRACYDSDDLPDPGNAPRGTAVRATDADGSRLDVQPPTQ